ncbi:MAG: metallopeptidase TldD-related protein [Acidobacteriota bacterium]
MKRLFLRASLLAGGLAVSSMFLASQTPIFPGGKPVPALPADEILLRAMRDEMARIPQLGVVGGKDAIPYFASYTVSDADSLHVGSVLGAEVNVSHSPYRAPAIELRVGTYESDNTGHVFSGAYSGTRMDGDWPLDNNYLTLRDNIWLATDRAFKTALESISRKRASQNSAAADANPLPDFSKVEPVVRIPKLEIRKIDQQAWTTRANRWSAVFKGYPEVLSSGTDLQVLNGPTTMLTSEGTMIRYEDGLAWAIGKAETQAADGMLLHDAVSIQSLSAETFPSDAEVLRQYKDVADNVRALTKAPQGEAYTGPVLFEPRAAAQLLSQLLGDNLRIPRRPLSDPGRAANVTPSELEARVGTRIMPDFFDIVDDSTQRTLNGKELVGFYEFDLEGVAPKPVNIVEKGVLKSFLTTRTPTKAFPASNGHARLPGNYGARSAAIGNLFVKSNESMPMTDLKRQLINMIGSLGRPYGMMIKKLDYPYSGSIGELQAVAQANQQSGGAARPLSPPLLAYRVYPDGREELVRGLRFHGVTARSLRDVLAASQETAVFEFVNTAGALAYLGSGGYLAATSVVSPGLLFEELEFETPRDQLPKPPTVPPPPITAP